MTALWELHRSCTKLLYCTPGAPGRAWFSDCWGALKVAHRAPSLSRLAVKQDFGTHNLEYIQTWAWTCDEKYSVTGSKWLWTTPQHLLVPAKLHSDAVSASWPSKKKKKKKKTQPDVPLSLLGPSSRHRHRGRRGCATCFLHLCCCCCGGAESHGGASHSDTRQPHWLVREVCSARKIKKKKTKKLSSSETRQSPAEDLSSSRRRLHEHAAAVTARRACPRELSPNKPASSLLTPLSPPLPFHHAASPRARQRCCVHLILQKPYLHLRDLSVN